MVKLLLDLFHPGQDLPLDVLPLRNTPRIRATTTVLDRAQRGTMPVELITQQEDIMLAHGHMLPARIGRSRELAISIIILEGLQQVDAPWLVFGHLLVFPGRGLPFAFSDIAETASPDEVGDCKGFPAPLCRLFRYGFNSLKSCAVVPTSVRLPSLASAGFWSSSTVGASMP